jgi:hypothetical protein
LSAVEVSEIHAYPTRPEGFEEPLFPTANSKREILEHLLEASWLSRASKLGGCTGEAAHTLEEPVELKSSGERTEVLRPHARSRCSRKRQRVVELLDRWREIRGWWDEDRHADRLVFRVLLSGGFVADLARERSGGWFLVGMVD